MKICKFLIVLFICLIANLALSDEINLSVDKKTITDGDIVKLTIEYNGDTKEEPDLSSLQQDFHILSRSTSSYINFTNGQITQAKQWILGLKPKKTGKIEIKPISIGDIRSNYIDIEVKELSNIAYIPDSNENINAPYFKIEQSNFPTSPYVQQQMIILVTIYDSIGLQNGTINIDENSQSNWSITALSDTPLIKKETINGKNTNVATFAFAAFPQKSGEIALPIFSFDGYYLKNNDIDLEEFSDFFSLGFNFSNIMGQKVPVRMRTKEEKINVRPIPKDFSGKQWLPLVNLTAEDSFSDNTIAKVGDVISRKLKITAVGVQQNMLPQLKFAESPSFKQYSEAPETTQQIIDGNITTTAIFNTVYIPTESGKKTLPPLEIEWFNTKTQQFEKTTIPLKIIVVEGKANFSSDIPPVLSSSVFKESTLEQNTEVKKKPQQKIFPVSLFYIISILLVLLILGSIVFLLKKSKNIYQNLVIQNLKKHDYKSVRENLIEWAKIKYQRPDIKNLNMIADIVQNNDFSNQLLELNKLLYSSNYETFNTRKFIEIFKKINKLKVVVQKNPNALPNLYD